VVGTIFAILGAAALPAAAQDISINLGQGTGGAGGLTERVIQLIAFVTVLSLAPSILVMMTSFTRIVVVLSLLRTALGTATAPPNAVIVALALFLTAFVMGPSLQSAYDAGVKPLMNNEISVEEAFNRSSSPLKVFMQKNVREKDLALFADLSREPRPATPEDMSLRILVPAFMISELKRAFAWLARDFEPANNRAAAGAFGKKKGRRGDNFWKHYWLWSLERACGAAGVKDLEGKDWYALGARHLLDRQKEDGGWRDPEQPLQATCFALLFLQRATVRALTPTPVTTTPGGN